MSDEVTTQDVEDMLALRFPKWKQWERDEFANRIEGILADRIAEARREGAAEALDEAADAWDRTWWDTRPRRFQDWLRRRRDIVSALRGEA